MARIELFFFEGFELFPVVANHNMMNVKDLTHPLSNLNKVNIILYLYRIVFSSRKETKRVVVRLEFFNK